MLYELPKAEKSRPRGKFLPVLFLKLTLILWALTAHTPVARAQSSGFAGTDGKISGTILSQGDDRTLGQIAVGLKSQSLGIFRSVLTDYDGNFEVRNLPAGTYEIVVEESGYEPLQTKAQLESSSLKLVLHLKLSQWLQARRSRYTVSVRELKIPSKAREELRKGLDRMAKNDLAGGLSHFQKATEACPGYYEAYYHRGAMEMKLGQRDEAMKSFQTAIDLSSGQYAWAEFGLGYLLYLEGKPGEAETIIRRGLEVDGDSPDGHVILGMVLLRLDHLEEAERSAREALLRKPEFAEAYLVLADVSVRRHEYRVQIENLEAYLRFDPTGPASERVRQAREAALKILGEQREEKSGNRE
jgi:tetratricopeptide (TPR) repeat protein